MCDYPCPQLLDLSSTGSQDHGIIVLSHQAAINGFPTIYKYFIKGGVEAQLSSWGNRLLITIVCPLSNF